MAVQNGGVPDIASSTLVILVSALLGVGVLIMMCVFGISRTLRRIERGLAELSSGEEAAENRLRTAEGSGGGAFEEFLNEDPARRMLPKGERFAAYRKWRREKGLNWANSQ